MQSASIVCLALQVQCVVSAPEPRLKRTRMQYTYTGSSGPSAVVSELHAQRLNVQYSEGLLAHQHTYALVMYMAKSLLLPARDEINGIVYMGHSSEVQVGF